MKIKNYSTLIQSQIDNTAQPVVHADTYISSSSKDAFYPASNTLSANKDSYRPIIRYDLSAMLKSGSGFVENGAEISFKFAVNSGSVTDSTQKFSVYAFTPGDGVGNANFAELTWNNCAEGSALYRGSANFLLKDQTSTSNVQVTTSNSITYVTYTFNYSAIKPYVSSDGYLVMGFDFQNTVKLYSNESSYKPTVTVTNGSSSVQTYSRRQSVLLLGQSNMAGRGFAEDVTPISDNRILMMNSSKQWVTMQEPIHFDKAEAGVGLAASFAKAFVETFNCEIGLVPAAVGGSSIGDWAVGGDFYNNAVAMAKEALKTSDICAILWHQGEANRDYHSTYAAKLQAILDALIAELGLDANKIVIITGELREPALTQRRERPSMHSLISLQAFTVTTVLLMPRDSRLTRILFTSTHPARESLVTDTSISSRLL